MPWGASFEEEACDNPLSQAQWSATTPRRIHVRGLDPMATERYGTSIVVVGEADGGVEVDLFESLASKFKALHARR